MTAASPFWTPERHADRRPFLIARNRIVAALRRWFEGEGFIEVEPAALQISPGNEAHLHGFATELVAPGGAPTRRYLHTSPEFAMKKLLAAGETRIFALARVFRNREAGALHAPEFTMLEWYRAGAPHQAVMADCAAILSEAAGTIDAVELRWRGRTADPRATAATVSVAEAFQRYAGIDLAATLADEAPDCTALAAAAACVGIRVASDDSWSDIFSRVLVQKVEPELGLGAATFLTDYPAVEAALARRKPADPRFAERFELYACGVELANGFGELTDPVEQRRRFELEMAEKERVHGERYPLDEDFLAALSTMPAASGVALGLDRLVMLLTGAPRIDLVQWTPVDTGEESFL
jgi:lysyl-tRNA synthetase class 2